MRTKVICCFGGMFDVALGTHTHNSSYLTYLIAYAYSARMLWGMCVAFTFHIIFHLHDPRFSLRFSFYALLTRVHGVNRA